MNIDEIDTALAAATQLPWNFAIWEHNPQIYSVYHNGWSVMSVIEDEHADILLEDCPTITDAEAIVAVMNAYPEMKSQITEANERALDAESQLSYFFETRGLHQDDIEKAVIEATDGYLHTCSVGGMSCEEITIAKEAIAAMATHGTFTDIFIRLLDDRYKALIEAVERSRDQFAYYAENHHAKGTVVSHSKALVNDAMVAMCRKALGEESVP